MINKKYKNKNSWLTKGLRNACKKKYNLYRDFIKLRTKESENLYNIYKNKLTEVLVKNYITGNY